jgi:uncharacterized protein with HEPN domain
MRDDRERLHDILDAAEKIHVRVQRGRHRFDDDEDLQIVLTHLVQIIGEAASRLSPEFINRNPRVPWRQITGMRHRVVHDYFAIDLDILWAAAINEVPRLAEEIRNILANLPDTPGPGSA